jgi:hypothetical protein
MCCHAPHTENGDKVNLIDFLRLLAVSIVQQMQDGVYGTLALDGTSWWTLSQL